MGVAYTIAQLIDYIIIQIRVKKYMYAKPLLKKMLVPLLAFGTSMFLYYVLDSWLILITATLLFSIITLFSNMQFIKEIVSTIFSKTKSK